LSVLIKASDYFTCSAEKIGTNYGVHAFIIGVTIVAFGTSLPELISSIVAVLKDSSEIVVGNVAGSNIANILLILGLAAVADKKMEIGYELMSVDVPFLVGTSFVLVTTCWDGVFGPFEGVLCLALIVIYLLYAMNTEREHEEDDKEQKTNPRLNRRGVGWKTWTILLVSAFLIYLGANYTIEAVIRLSELLNMGKEIVAISVVALGTSLPELVVSFVAARKGKPGMAVGNVLGSNIFNATAVMGIPALVGSLSVPQSMRASGFPMMLIAMLLFVFITQDRRITKWEGWLLLSIYVLFVGKVFNLL